MCAIVGLVDFRAPPGPDGVVQAASLLHKRGPDDAGHWHAGPVALAHRRLSIIDLSAAGRQPMTSCDGRYVIVFNGEIYNFRQLRAELADQVTGWRSDSDTEVILAAFARWGADCLTRLRGMFAFAIWDRDEEALFAARDRMGVKPLYYRAEDQRLSFASRPRALLRLDPAAGDEVDIDAMRLYLECGYVPAPRSIFASVRKLPPAHWIRFGRRGTELVRYWDFRKIQVQGSWAGRKQDELLDELDELVSRSVRSRMVSDVPIGAFLSGGIDSSLVVAMMRKHATAPVKTFTIGFDDGAYDESAHAAAVAHALGTEHHCERLEADRLLELLPAFAEEYDEPFYDSSAFATLAVSRSARRHVSVSLSGDGGDELFGGYHYYRLAQRLEPLYLLPRGVRSLLARTIGFAPGHRSKLLAAALLQTSAAEAFAFARSIQKDFGSVLHPDALRSTQGYAELFRHAIAQFAPGLSSAELGMRFDAAYTLPDEYLQKVDVASMAFSLEARDPLLDHELVEWAMKLPLCWKLRGNQGKYLLRQLAYRYVDRTLLDRPKMGFAVPIDRWLRGPLADWSRDLLNDRSLFAELPLDQRRALALHALHQSGRRNVHPLLWAVLMLLAFWSHHRRASAA